MSSRRAEEAENSLLVGRKAHAQEFYQNTHYGSAPLVASDAMDVTPTGMGGIGGGGGGGTGGVGGAADRNAAARAGAVGAVTTGVNGGGQQSTARFNRALSVAADLTPSNLNPTQQVRRDLYGSLPFTSVFGMTHRERHVKRIASERSFGNLADLAEGALGEEEALEHVDVDAQVMTIPLLMAVLAAVLAEFLVGFNTGVMNAPADVVFPGHTTTQWSLAVSTFAIGGPAGAAVGGVLANKIGRRGAILVTAVIFIVGGGLMSLAPSIYWLIPARFIIGFASGSATVVVPIYLGELAPPIIRGTLGACTQFSMVIGLLAADLLAFPLATSRGWRYLFGVTPLLGLLTLLCAPFLLESPRWLINEDDTSLEARRVLKKVRGFRNDEEVELEVNMFLYASMKHKTRHASAHSGGAVMDLLRDTHVRILVVSCIVLHVAQQLCGINAVFYYSNMFFVGVIDNPLVGTTLVAVVNVLATYVALKLMDSTKRRTLLLVSTGGMLVSAGVMTLALTGHIPSMAALAAVCAFVAAFELGLGPIAWLIVAEMFDQRYVATAMAVASQINWMCNFFVGLTFPFVNIYLGAYSFMPFAAVLLAAFLFIWLYLPETHGRTVEEIMHLVRPIDETAKLKHYTIVNVDDLPVSQASNPGPGPGHVGAGMGTGGGGGLTRSGGRL